MKLTNKERAQAQFLHNTYHSANRIADERDPKRANKDTIANKCTAIARLASEAFYTLIQLHPAQVDLIELKVR